MSLAGGTSGSLDVINKQQSTSPSVIRNAQNFDSSVDGNLADDRDSTSLFRKVLDRELPESISAYIYLRFRMDFTSNSIRSEALNFVNLGLPVVNASYEFNTFGTPASRVRRPTYGPHWSAPDHIFEEATAVGMSRTRSE